MKTIDNKIVKVAYSIDYIIYDSGSEHIIISEVRDQLDFAYYSSIAAIREKYRKAKISLIVDDYGGDMVFTLKRLNEWVKEVEGGRHLLL